MRHEARQVVQQAHDAAAHEAQYWITDELQLQKQAADLITTTINNITASLTALHSHDNNNDDCDMKRPSRKVWMDLVHFLFIIPVQQVTWNVSAISCIFTDVTRWH